MADKQAIINDIRKNYANALSIARLTEALGFKDRRAAVNFMEGVPTSNAANHKKRSCRSSARQRTTFGSIRRNDKYDLPRATYG